MLALELLVVGCWRHTRQEYTHQLQELAQSIPWDWLKPPPAKSMTNPTKQEPPKHELELPTKLGWDNESHR